MDNIHISPSESEFQLIEPLTSRELEVLKLIADGLSNKEIAEHLTLALSTIKWYDRQIYSKLAVNSREEAVARARDLGILETGPLVSRLPQPATPFIGRLDDLRAIKRHIRDPRNRLVTLVGLGGIGKTRLAIQAAEEMLVAGDALFRDGVYYAPLETIFETDAIVPAVAEALGFQFYEGGASDRAQVVDYLRGKRLLLVLDNFEQLIGRSSADLLAEMLHAAPGLKFLITSRERLNQVGEQVYLVGGMPLPDLSDLIWAEAGIPSGMASGSVVLFQQTARRVKPDFDPDQDDLQAIGEICQLVEGMPLGIELAAAWAPVLSPGEILEEIQGSLDFLETDMRAVPDRQRSLRAVFDASWKLLSEGERQAVAGLSVFCGGFTRQAAEGVASVSIKALLDLVNKSWIQSMPDGRYYFHPVVQVYAREAASDLFETLQQRHAGYYCRLVADRKDGLYGLQQKETLIEMDVETGNLQAAWKTAIELKRFDLIDQAADGYSAYFDLRSRFDKGAIACAQAVQALEAARPADSPELFKPEPGSCLLGKLLTWQAHFTRDYKKQAGLIERAQAIFDDLEFSTRECQRTQAWLRCVHGQHIAWEDRLRSGEYFQRGMELAGELGDRYIQALAMSSLGWIAWVTSDADQADMHLRGSLDIRREIGDQRGVAYCLNMLGILARDQSCFSEAEALQRDSLKLLEEVGASFQLSQHEYVLGSTIAIQGRFEEALQVSIRSEQRLVELGYRGPFLAKPYHIKGNILLDLGRYDEARANAQHGLKIARQYNSQQDTAIALDVLGAECLVRGEYQTALEYLAESYELLKAIKPFSEIIPLTRLVRAQWEMGNQDQAQEYLKLGITTLMQSNKALFAGAALPPAALILTELGAGQLAVTVYTLAHQYPKIANSRWVADLYGEGMRDYMASLPDQTAREAEARAEGLDIWDALIMILDEIENSAIE